MGKISRQKAVRIKFFVDSAFSNMLYRKKRKPGNAGNQQKAFKLQKAPSVNLLLLLENCQKALTLLCKYNFGFNNKKATFKLQWYVLLDNFEQHFES